MLHYSIPYYEELYDVKIFQLKIMCLVTIRAKTYSHSRVIPAILSSNGSFCFYSKLIYSITTLFIDHILFSLVENTRKLNNYKLIHFIFKRLLWSVLVSLIPQRFTKFAALTHLHSGATPCMAMIY